jgi:tellurite resistance protein TehA-like permease
METIMTFLQHATYRPFPLIGASTGTAAGGLGVSFFSSTLPVLQWIGAALAIVSAIVGITVGVLHIRHHLKVSKKIL